MDDTELHNMKRGEILKRVSSRSEFTKQNSIDFRRGAMQYVKVNKDAIFARLPASNYRF